MIKIVTTRGQDIGTALAGAFQRALREIQSQAGAEMAKGLRDSVQEHISRKNPGSRHWDPDKVSISGALGVQGNVDVDIPGAGRAYHDVDIRPVHKKALAIPLHSNAFLGKPSEVPDLILIKKKDGKAFLAQELKNGGLRFMYVLKDHVHQNQDPTLMPSDQTMAKRMERDVMRLCQRAIQRAMQSV